MQEHNLRILTYSYNGERYLSSLLPVHDELQTDSIPVGPGFNGFQRYEMDRTDVEEELDQEFQKNYKTWLDSETFYQTDDENEEDIQMNKTAPDTPYPQDTQKRTEISYEQLTKEINKIYIEQLNEQFNPVTDDGSIDSVDEQDLIYNLIQVQDATVQKWKENQQSSAIKQDAKYKYFLFDDMINSDENYM